MSHHKNHGIRSAKVLEKRHCLKRSFAEFWAYVAIASTVNALRVHPCY